MFGHIKAKIEDNTKAVAEAADKAAFRNFGHAAARISKDAKASIDRAKGPSAPGEAPHTHKRVFLRRAIRYAANRDGAVIGPQHSIVGEAGAIHEFGETFKGAQYPERPFMEPALEQNLNRFAGEWQGSIGE